jgi:hypothetical protein
MREVRPPNDEPRVRAQNGLFSSLVRKANRLSLRGYAQRQTSFFTFASSCWRQRSAGESGTRQVELSSLDS